MVSAKYFHSSSPATLLPLGYSSSEPSNPYLALIYDNNDTLCAHFSLIPQPNVAFKFQARFYHSAFTQQSNWAYFVIILNCVRIS